MGLHTAAVYVLGAVESFSADGRKYLLESLNQQIADSEVNTRHICLGAFAKVLIIDLLGVRGPEMISTSFATSWYFVTFITHNS